MQRFITEYFGKPVLLKKERAVVGIIEDFVINPDNGELLGVLVREGFGKKNQKALPKKDIEVVGKDFILINSYEQLGDIDEIVRIKQVLDKEIRIIANKVETESGQYLGRVFDYTIDFNLYSISRLYVSNKFFGFSANQHIIANNQIIEITKEKIIVSDATIKISSTKVAAKPVISPS
jgi:uncharacterized protein YrrD